tara:strand:- start:102 stop:395 length:294 start_codon:yes stop_codon:yes gene_type:complete
MKDQKKNTAPATGTYPNNFSDQLQFQKLKVKFQPFKQKNPFAADETSGREGLAHKTKNNKNRRPQQLQIIKYFLGVLKPLNPHLVHRAGMAAMKATH